MQGLVGCQIKYIINTASRFVIGKGKQKLRNVEKREEGRGEEA